MKAKPIDISEMTAEDIRAMVILPLYLSEITYRYNARGSRDAFDRLLHLASNP